MAGIPGQTTKGELGYSQRGGIQYLQEVHNQADMIRPYIKWDYEIKRVENAALVINSAYRMAASEPSIGCWFYSESRVTRSDSSVFGFSRR